MSRRITSFGVALVAFLILTQPCRADQTQNELWPEANAYFKFASRLRLYLLAAPTYSPQSWTGDKLSSFGEMELGAHVDLSFKPIFRRALRNATWERERYLWARVGYSRLTTFAGAPESREDRGILELTARLALPGDVWAVSRARIDLRNKDGSSSTRYRYRLTLEREMTLFKTVAVPYVDAEPFYDSRYDAISRWRYEAGIEVVIDQRWRLEPHYLRQEDSRSEPKHTNAFGLVLKYYR